MSRYFKLKKKLKPRPRLVRTVLRLIYLMLLTPVVPAIVPVVSPLIVALLVAARPGPSLPAARVLLVRRLLRLHGPVPPVTPTSVLLLPGDSNKSHLSASEKAPSSALQQGLKLIFPTCRSPSCVSV